MWSDRSWLCAGGSRPVGRLLFGAIVRLHDPATCGV